MQEAQVTQIGQEKDELLDLMHQFHIPPTRENYLLLKYFGSPPPWSAELEEDIPKSLQDWKSRTFALSKGTDSSHGHHQKPKKRQYHSPILPDLEAAEDWT